MDNRLELAVLPINKFSHVLTIFYKFLYGKVITTAVVFRFWLDKKRILSLVKKEVQIDSREVYLNPSYFDVRIAINEYTYARRFRKSLSNCLNSFLSGDFCKKQNLLVQS